MCKPGVEPEWAFGFLRLLFVLTRPQSDVTEVRRPISVGLRPYSSSQNIKMADQGAIQTMFKLMRRWSKQTPLSQVTLVSLRECLQNIFNFTLGMGTLGKATHFRLIYSYVGANTGHAAMDYRTYLPNYTESINLLLTLFNLPIDDPESDPALWEVLFAFISSLLSHVKLKAAIINCFVNIPVEYYAILVVVNDKEKTLKSLFDILEYHVQSVDRSLHPPSPHLLFFPSVSHFLMVKFVEVRESNATNDCDRPAPQKVSLSLSLFSHSLDHQILAVMPSNDYFLTEI